MKAIFWIFIVIGTIVVFAIALSLKGTPVVVQPPSNTLKVGDVKTFTWNKNMIDNDLAQIEVLQLISTNPDRFDLVRKIGTIPNTGTYMWTVTSADIGNAIFFEVACPPVQHECHPVPIFGAYIVHQ